MKAIYWTLTLCFVASAVAQSPKPEDVVDLDWGATPNVSRLDSLYFAGQVDAEGLERAKESGVSVVVNLRGASEHDWDEAAAAEALPVNLLMSGPAGGVSGAIWVARQAGYKDLLTIDMGGTSTDVALVQGGEARLRRETTVGDVTVRASSVDIRTVQDRLVT